MREYFPPQLPSCGVSTHRLLTCPQWCPSLCCGTIEIEKLTIELPLNLVQCLRGSIQTDPVTFFSTKSKSRFSLILRNDFYGLAQNLSQISMGSQVIYPNDFCDPDIGNAKERRCMFFRELSCVTF